ncbi:MAG: O-antigen ligase family protein [Oscillospiraceae bacterium]
MPSTTRLSAPRLGGALPRSGGYVLSSPSRLAAAQQALEQFWNSPRYFPTLTLLAALFLFSGETLAGFAAMLLLLGAFLALCPDLLASFYPFMLVMLLSTRYYENSGVLYRCWWAALPAVAALALRLLRCRLPARKGRFDGSLAAVSAATLLGGVGVIPAEEYFSFVGLYYSLGLGLLMLGLYRLLRAEFARRRSYDLSARFAGLLYACGVFTALLVAERYLPYLRFFFREFEVIYIPCRNYFTTMLLMALPAPFYFMRRDKRHILGAAVIYGAALLTGSRSALLFGSALLALCLLWALRGAGLSRRRTLIIALGLGAAALGGVLLLTQTLFLSRTVDGVLISAEDSRITFFLQAIRDFLAHPLTGQGLGNMKNSHIFLGVSGSMVWYHNYFAQILGSMGLVGLAAYAWLLHDRWSLLRAIRGTGAEVLGLAYLGMLLISMTNPGEFSPLPGEFLVVSLFAVAEEAAEVPSTALLPAFPRT